MSKLSFQLLGGKALVAFPAFFFGLVTGVIGGAIGGLYAGVALAMRYL